MPRNQPERALQYEVVQQLRALLAPPAFFAASFQSGVEHRRFPGFFQKMGIRPGMPDLMVFGPSVKIAAVELKVNTWAVYGAQKEVMHMFQELSIPYFVCRSWAEVRNNLELCGFEFRSEVVNT